MAHSELVLWTGATGIERTIRTADIAPQTLTANAYGRIKFDHRDVEKP